MAKKETSKVYMNTHYGSDSEEAMIESFSKKEVEVDEEETIKNGDKVKIEALDSGNVKMFKICMSKGENSPEISKICIDKKVGDEIEFKNKKCRILEALR